MLKCLENTKYLYRELIERGFSIPIKPVINIFGVKTINNHPIDISQLHTELWKLGWTTSLVDGFLRFVIMPQTTTPHITRLLEVIDNILQNIR